MLDILAQFDALGLGALAGSLLFLAGLIWLLVDNRSFEEVSRRHENSVAPRARPAALTAMTRAADPTADATADATIGGAPDGGSLKEPERHDPAGPGRGTPTRPQRGTPRRPVRTKRAA